MVWLPALYHYLGTGSKLGYYKAMKHALIMAGGSGTRLWPVSRQTSPKQFQRFAGERTLIQQTFDRIKSVIPAEQVWVVTTKDQAGLVAEQLPEIKPEHIISEPVGRNTAPAIGLGTMRILAEDPEAIVAVLPSDHYVGKPTAFADVASTVLDYISNNQTFIGTIGIKPTDANTGYGYIKLGDELERVGEWPIFQVESFIEKPDAKTAQTFFESWEYLWNGGYFFFAAAQLMTYFEQFIPETKKQLETYLGAPDQTELYQAIASEPIDKAIAERLTNLAVVPADLEWSDLGNWAALHEILLTDESRQTNQMVSQGQHIDFDSNNCLVVTKDKLVATIGLKDVVVVDTGDAILVCHRDEVHNVKNVVEQLKNTGQTQYL